MSVYDINGAEISDVYGVSGDVKRHAYDINGNQMLDISGNYDIKVMTYNVGHWYIGTQSLVPADVKAKYFDLHNGIMSRHRPDVLLMQECRSEYCMDGSPASEILAPYFTAFNATSLDKWYVGHEICTNGYEMSDYTSHKYTSNRGNYPTFETVKILYDGKIINIVNAHNDYYADYQPSEVADLLSAISDMEYFILCGDFNINLANIDTTDEQYIINVKPFVDAGYHVGNCAYAWIPTYFGTSSPTGKYTDEVITSPNIDIVRLYADTTKLTDDLGEKVDHVPLIAELIIN